MKGVIFTFTPESIGVRLTGGNGKLVKKTAAKGSFHIKSIPAGTYKVVVKMDEYKEITVEITDGVRRELTVKLEKA